MKAYIYCEDTLRHWSNDSAVKQNCEQQHDVYVFNPESGTACCEGALSYAMHLCYGTFTPKDGVELDDDVRDQIDEEIYSSESTDVRYYKCSMIRDLPQFGENEVPYGNLPPSFVIVDERDYDLEEIEDIIGDVRGNPPL